MEKIRVLIVDDSGVMRRILSDIITQDKEMEVIGTAADGIEAIQKVESFHPHVITMDVNMPRMNGILAVEHIMKSYPTPIVMISSVTQYGAEVTLKALELGAVDFIAKPSGDISLDIESLREEIIAKVKTAAKIKVVRTVSKSIRSPKSSTRALKLNSLPISKVYPSSPTEGVSVVAIGSSTGGPYALNVILSELPVHFPCPILIVQHMPEKFTKELAKQLNQKTALKVVEAQDGDKIKPGTVYIAPGSHHMKVTPPGIIQLSRGEKVNGYRPSVDVLMSSVSEVYGKKAIVVLLTGMGSDGARGLYKIKQAQGKTLVQDEQTCTVFGMPKAAIELGGVDYIVPLPLIARRLMGLVRHGNFSESSVF
jgi:two-component system chemotaxis response regulator CheB